MGDAVLQRAVRAVPASRLAPAGCWLTPCCPARSQEAAVMTCMRHPNVVGFMGVCMMPPCIVTGAAARAEGGWLATLASWRALACSPHDAALWCFKPSTSAAFLTTHPHRTPTCAEYCAKGSLFDVLRAAARSKERGAALTWQLRLHMAVDAARGLLYLHRHAPPIIHRDVKSPNFLVDEHWRVKASACALPPSAVSDSDPSPSVPVPLRRSATSTCPKSLRPAGHQMWGPARAPPPPCGWRQS